tara:strand:+ start:260 stop:505 length:246 start_codon:yes stop_codon:yes gene_type:complete
MNVEDTIREVLESQCSACCMDSDVDREFTVRELNDALREHIATRLAELMGLEDGFLGLGADGLPVWDEDQDWVISTTADMD